MSAPTTSVRARTSARTIVWLQGLAGLAGFAALLEIVPRIGLVSPLYLPPFSTIMVALYKELHDRRVLDRTRRHARSLVDRACHIRDRRRGDRHRHRQFAGAADADQLDDRVSATHSLRRPDTARRAAVRFADPIDAHSGGLRLILAGADSGALRRAGCRPGRARDSALIRSRHMGANPLRHVAHRRCPI